MEKEFENEKKGITADFVEESEGQTTPQGTAEPLAEQPEIHQVKDLKGILVRAFADIRRGVSPNVTMNASIALKTVTDFEHCIRTLAMCKFVVHDDKLLDGYLRIAAAKYGISIKKEMLRLNNVPIKTIKSAKNAAKKIVQAERRKEKRNDL